jgi:outer membrane receptor protein involved in Fe transport
MSKLMKRARNPISSAVQIALLTASPATVTLAQDDSSIGYIDEIIVQARKRSETVVEVPMNISTVGQEEILARNLLQTEDVYRTIAGGANPRGELILRGLSGGNAPSPNTTSVWTDDILYETTDLFDVQRIEILRGPQGTLFGSNAIGGTVRIVTNKPVMNEVQVFGAGVMNSENNRDGIGTTLYAGLNLPIVEDVLAARIIGSYGRRDGKIENTFTGTSGSETETYLRAQLLWEPTDEWSLNFMFINEHNERSGYEWADRSNPGYYYEANLTENPAALYNYDVTLSFPDCPPNVERAECRLGGPISGSHDPKFSVWEIMDEWLDDEYNVISLRVQKDNLWEGATITYAGSFQTWEGSYLDNWSRNDANDMFRTWIIGDQGHERSTHELRLQSSNDSPFQWIVGAFYDDHEEDPTPNGQWQYHGADDKSRAIAEYLWGYYWGLGDPTQIGMDLYGDGTKNYNYNLIKFQEEETAFFGEVTYVFDFDNGSSLELMGGMRNYDLQSNIHEEVSGIWIGDEPQENNDVGSEDGNRYKFSVAFMPNDTMSVFFVYSEGYRPGGNNGPNAPQDCSMDENIGSYVNRFDSDEIENYEIGFKGLAFNRRFQFSSAIYHIDWSGVQTSVYMPSCGFSYTANAATAESEGIEFESTTLLTDTLQLQVNGAYTDSKMTSDAPGIDAKAGDSMTMVPEYNFYIALEQDINLFSRDGSVRLDVAGYGEYKSHFDTLESDISPAYEVVSLAGNLRLTDNARVGIYINNLLDEEIFTYRSTRYHGPGDDGGWNQQSNYYGAERNVSVRFDFDF